MVWRRFWAGAALVVTLVLPLAPLGAAPVAAAPPESPREATSESASTDSDSGTDSETEPDSPNSMPQDLSPLFPDAKDRLNQGSGPEKWVVPDAGSVRLRGLEAPVEFEQQREDQDSVLREEEEEEPDKSNGSNDDEERDSGDGPVGKSKRQEASRERDRAPQNERVWPMPADFYTFTQEFGCVQQLGNLYFPGDGCPADAPVIHTGVDLAAPEGTPFYAAASGWVTLAGFDRPTADANTRIIIQHDGRNEGFATDYLHWIASYVEEGDYVRAGDPIGEVGSVGYSTGPHLHFSVTDLKTGEHIDPVRWVPGEPGLDGYVSRTPNAQLRLPSGTTAGQPESADPSPPAPPTKEDVPATPPGDRGNHRDRSERRSERKGDERRAEKRGESASDSERSGKKRSRKDAAASEASPDTAAEEAKNNSVKKRDRSRDRERTRERNKDGSRSESSDNGEDGGNRDKSDRSNTGERRRDRDASNDSSDGDRRNRSEKSGDRDKGDGGRSDSVGRGERGGRDERTGGRPGQNQDSGTNDKRNGGGGKDRAQDVSSEGEATGGDSTADANVGDGAGLTRGD